MVRCPGVALLTTSRVVVQPRAEREYVVRPLSFPVDLAVPVDMLASSPAVALFVERAKAVRRDFVLTEGNAAAVARSAGASRACRWPMLRRGEEELIAEAREGLGPDRFREVFAAGTRLNQREAIAAATPPANRPRR